MSKAIAFFDFDGTITKKDTLLEFIKFSKGTFNFLLGFFVNSPYLIAYKLKIISNQKAKEKTLAYFFKNLPVNIFQDKCDAFAKTIIPSLLRPDALKEIKKLKADGFEIVIVSASPENWISLWAESMEVKLIASKMNYAEGKVTGKLVGRNCHGEEKVRRIKDIFNLSHYSIINAYGDTRGDIPMLNLAHNAFMKPFR